MPVNANNYGSRGGVNSGIVIKCPNLVADRLVYFDCNAESGAWVIRDFIGECKLENRDSHLTIADIEQASVFDEYPPWRNVETENHSNWKSYLLMRTTAAFHTRTVSTDPPNNDSGGWRPL